MISVGFENGFFHSLSSWYPNGTTPSPHNKELSEAQNGPGPRSQLHRRIYGNVRMGKTDVETPRTSKFQNIRKNNVECRKGTVQLSDETYCCILLTSPKVPSGVDSPSKTSIL